jgi:hypothetical protein
MSHFLQASEKRKGTAKRTGHEIIVRNVVDFAREVRIILLDSQVIYGSVIPDARALVGAFLIRPWGLNSAMTIRFDAVYCAAPVKQMDWQKQRTISTAQAAGVFRDSATRATHPAKAGGEGGLNPKLEAGDEIGSTTRSGE